MSWQALTHSHAGRYALAIALLTVSFVLLPLVALALPALPAMIGRLLFYWPQYALLPGGLREPLPGVAVYAASVAPIASGMFWLAAVAIFVRLTSRWRMAVVLLSLLPGAALLSGLVLAFFDVLGFVPVLDGP